MLKRVFEMINKIVELVSLKSKKKGSHVGIIVSFIMFVSFIIFFYIIIQPTITSENKKNVFDSLREQIISLCSSELTTISLKVEGTSLPNCIQLANFLVETGIGNKIIARDNVSMRDAKVSGNDLYITINENRLLWIYNSEEFINIATGTMTGCSSNYNVGLITNNKEVFEKKILTFIANYSGNYEATKKQLKIPSENDFGFEFIYSDGTIISAQSSEVQAPVSNINVYVNKIPVQYIGTEGKREAGYIRVKIW